MIEANKKWLAEANKNLLESYVEPPTHEPAQDPPPLSLVKITHEDRPPKPDRDYISPGFYQSQRSNILETEDLKPSRINFLVIVGLDGGYDALRLEHTPIKHAIVVEPSIESFNHSLSVVDWPKFINRLECAGGSFFFHIGPLTDNIKRSITSHILGVGVFNGSNTFMSVDNNPVSGEVLKDVMGCFQGAVSSLGFYDDERVGLAHSIPKISATFLSETRPPVIDRPIVVCGNGPSLTEALPQIRKKRDQITLMSCGSTMGTLYKEGIKPDFHIEQERPLSACLWLERTTTPEFRKGVQCIALNVVHPKIRELFDDVAYALKANDLGTAVITSVAKSLPVLYNVNPMVSNAGVSIAANLGFKNIYLVGIDCAFSASGASHAEGHDPLVVKPNTLTTRGSFGGEVGTNPAYNSSREAVEAVISYHRETKFFNFGSGAYIHGARPVRKIRSSSSAPVDVTHLLRPQSYTIDKAALQREFTANIYKLRQLAISFPDECSGIDEAYFFINQFHRALMEIMRKNRLFWYLVKGTLSTQLMFLAGCAEVSLPHFDKASAIFKELVASMQDDINRRLFEFDVWGDYSRLPEDINESM